MVSKNVLVDMLGIDNNITRLLTYEENVRDIKHIDWQQIYPFEEESQEENKEIDIKKLNASEKNRNKLINKYLNIIDKVKEQLDNYTTTYLFGYEKIVEVAKGYENNIKWNLIRLTDDQTPIKLPEGQWLNIFSKEDYSDIANNIVKFNNYLTEKGIELIYVQAPVKTDNITNGGMFDIYKDYNYENANNLISILNQNNVNVLDLREKMKEENIDYLGAFFKTDHHWKPEAGLWASKQISNYMNQNWNMNINLDIFEEEKYSDEIYKKVFLGSQGKRVTLAKTNKEDFNILMPNFETNITVEVPSIEINKTGTTRETLIDNELLYNIDSYNNSMYDAYSYGNKDLIYTKNNLIKDDEKILLLRDSFSNVVLPYLSLGVENLYSIDQRTFDGSIKQFIEKNGITKVIILYYTEPMHQRMGNMFNYE